MQKINIMGFASEFTACFPNEEAAQAFTGAMVDIGSPMTERDARALALACGGAIVEILPEHVLLALDLAAMNAADFDDETLEAPAVNMNPIATLVTFAPDSVR